MEKYRLSTMCDCVRLKLIATTCCLVQGDHIETPSLKSFIYNFSDYFVILCYINVL